MNVDASLRKLLGMASAPSRVEPPSLDESLLVQAGPLGDELLGMLREKNGFFAFESALHVLSDRAGPQGLGLAEWNSPTLWRHCYQGMAEGCLFFAEDVFGVQFGIADRGVFTFDPETGEREHLASTLYGWAKAILSDYDTLTGHRLAHEWQMSNGSIPPGKRLVPKVPFVLGGEFNVANLYLMDSAKGMQWRGDIAVQLRDLPDGAQVKFESVE